MINSKHKLLPILITYFFWLLFNGLCLYFWLHFRIYCFDTSLFVIEVISSLLILILSYWPIDFLISSITTFVIYKKSTLELHSINKLAILPKELPLIYSIHTICNDFSPAQLEYCLKQTYSNVKWFILDDSTNLEMITQIDNFVKQNKNIEIIRRPIEHVKQWRTRGGAIKYFVDNIKEFGLIPDYIALNDSTNLFEKDFLEKNLRFFYSSANNGDLVAVQEKYLSYPGGTLFSKYLYPLEELVNYNTNLYANFGATCNEFYLTGTLIKYNAFKEVPLTIVNNASPDTCSSFFMLKNNKKILFSNLGSTYKLRPLNYNDRKNQLLKWNNAHINAIKKRFWKFSNNFFFNNYLFWRKINVIFLPFFVLFNWINLFYLNPFVGSTFYANYIFMIFFNLLFFAFFVNACLCFFKKMKFIYFLKFVFFQQILYMSLGLDLVIQIILNLFFNKNRRYIVTPKKSLLSNKFFISKIFYYFFIVLVINSIFLIYVYFFKDYFVENFSNAGSIWYWINLYIPFLFFQFIFICKIFLYFISLFNTKIDVNDSAFIKDVVEKNIYNYDFKNIKKITKEIK